MYIVLKIYICVNLTFLFYLHKNKTEILVINKINKGNQNQETSARKISIFILSHNLTHF